MIILSEIVFKSSSVGRRKVFKPWSWFTQKIPWSFIYLTFLPKKICSLFFIGGVYVIHLWLMEALTHAQIRTSKLEFATNTLGKFTSSLVMDWKKNWIRKTELNPIYKGTIESEQKLVKYINGFKILLSRELESNQIRKKYFKYPNQIYI